MSSAQRRISAVIAVAVLSCWSADFVQARVLRAADVHPDGYPTVEAVEYFGELLARATDGRLRVRMYAGRQLGEERDTLEQTVIGAIDIDRVFLPTLNNVVPETIVLSLPFVFRSVEHRDRVLGGEIGREILAALEPYGLIGLAFYDSGVRSFYSPVRPIRHPDDLHGLRIRVPSSDVSLAMIEALGGNATPMEFGQVYEAIRNGTVDGAENNWPSFASTRHFEVAKYYSLTQHSMAPEVLVMSKVTYDSLTPADRQAVHAAARASVERMRALWNAEVERARAEVLAGGDNVIVDDIDVEAFEEAVRPVYERFASDPELASLLRRIREAR